MNMFLVDDDPELRKMYRQAFENWGYTVTEAEDGISAQEVLKTSKFDVMLSDVMMPKCDGVQMLEELHKNNTIVNCGRIVLMSNLSDSTITEKVSKLGVYRILSKVETTPSTIKQVLEEKLS
jgi:CheY-like chemotaxis protein